VADLGTGSGAIALALAHDCRSAQVCAVDASEAALAVARGNGARLGLPVEWHLSDWWSALGGRRFDLVVANPPYIAGADPHLAGLHHEPQTALTPGGDGLADLHRIAAGAMQHLAPGACLLLEHGFDQGDAVRDILRGCGLHEVATRVDLSGHPRCTGARR
jgi:release factor glutamine methyltransferase